MPTTPACPRMKPNRRNMRMERTLRVVGTKTPAKVPSLLVPPTGLGKAPGLGFASSMPCDGFVCVGSWGGNAECSRRRGLERDGGSDSRPWLLLSWAASGKCEASPCLASKGVSSLSEGEGMREERLLSRSPSSMAARVAKLEWVRGGIRLRSGAGSVMLRGLVPCPITRREA